MWWSVWTARNNPNMTTPQTTSQINGPQTGAATTTVDCESVRRKRPSIYAQRVRQEPTDEDLADYVQQNRIHIYPCAAGWYLQGNNT